MDSIPARCKGSGQFLGYPRGNLTYLYIFGRQGICGSNAVFLTTVELGESARYILFCTSGLYEPAADFLSTRLHIVCKSVLSQRVPTR